jgi:hypothetical protein
MWGSEATCISCVIVWQASRAYSRALGFVGVVAGDFDVDVDVDDDDDDDDGYYRAMWIVAGLCL